MDSVLRAACAGSGGVAPDLLTVRFRAGTTAEERAAIAREVGGTLLGTSEHADVGLWYLRVPGAGADVSVADSLILYPPVLEVSSTRCPS